MTADSAAVFAEFHRRLLAFVSRRVRHAADAEDIVQDAFLRIHRHLAEVRGADRLAAWVFQVARSAIVDHYRRQRRPAEPSVLDEAAVDPDVVTGDPAAGELQELAACLEPMVEALPAADREAIRLADLEGVTQRKAAARAGVTLSGMKSRVQRARQKLKAMLLDCCRVELDVRGRVVTHEPRDGSCQPCGPGASPAARSGNAANRRRC